MNKVEANSAKTDFLGKIITGRVNQLNPSIAKPEGSPYISVRMSIGTGTTIQIVNTDLCVDTGADFTVCDSAFLEYHFGKDALTHLVKPWRLPKLKSASARMAVGLLRPTASLGALDVVHPKEEEGHLEATLYVALSK
jgi:hypothetical protein